MLKGLTSTFRNNCNNIELTYKEYIVIEGQTIPIRAKLSDDCYENGNFMGSFILKTIQFETSNDVKFRNKEFEYYKVVNGESIKIGTFITTEITDNDTTELVKVVGMDYGLKTQVEYTSSLDYTSGNVTLLDVWNECCELSGLESGVDEFENSNFIVDSDQFTGTGATIRDVFIGIALSSGSFIKVMNDDKIYPIFKTHTEDLLETTINTNSKLENVYEIDKTKELKGNTYQQTYTGKNLFGLSNASTNIGVTYTFNGSELTLNGTTTGEGNIYNNTNVITLPAGTYTFSSKILSGSFTKNSRDTAIYFKNSNNASEVLFEITGNLNYTRNITKTLDVETTLRLQIYTNGTNMVFNNLKIAIQIEQGSTATSYEPYVGGVPSPNPDYPQEIKSVTGRQVINVVGKNLFIPTLINNGSIISCTNCTATLSENEYSITATGSDMQFGQIRPSGSSYINSLGTLYKTNNASKIYILCTNTLFVRNYITFYDENLVSLGYTRLDSNTGSVNVPNNAKYFSWRIGILNSTSGTTYKTKVMVSTSEINEYEEYKGNTYEVNLGNIELNKIDDYQDRIYKENGTWYIEKKIGKVVLDGSERWTQRNTGDGNTTFTFNINLLNVGAFGSKNVYCNTFPYEQISSSGNEGIGFESGLVTQYIQIKRSRLSALNVDAFKTWLSTHNTEVYYVLATPQVEVITNQELINQLESIRLLKGTNNISITSEDLTGDLKLTYWNNNSEIVEDYTELEDKRDTQPISCVRLGMSQVDGENVDMIDEDLVEEYGENWLILNDNPFAYNQEKRQQLIPAIFNKVKGFGYSAFVSKTSFKPYMTCGDTLKFRNRNGDLVDSILLRYSHEYKENDMQIQLQAPSETSAEVKYVYPLTEIDAIKRTQVEVDKDKVQITNLTAQTSTIEDNLTQNYYTKDEANTLVQTAQTGLTNTFSEAGGNNIFRNTGLWFEQRDTETKTGKNLLPYPYTDTTKTVNGITFTDLGDGTIKINGTATANASFKLLGSDSQQYAINGNYIYGGLTSDIRVQVVHYNPGYTVLGRSIGTSTQIDKNTYTTGYIEIVVQNGQVVNNKIIKPMLTETQDNTYEPYYEYTNNYEFWEGPVIKAKEEKASNYSALLLQKGTVSQEQLVPNGNYTVSFKYKKLVQLASVKCVINDIEIELDSLTDKEVIQTLEVNSQHIKIQFVSDTANSCEIYDLMVNAGLVKLAYSQNQNETTTDTVNISKGITITSSDIEVTFKANADGIRTLDKYGNRKTEFTDTGLITARATIEDEAEIVGLLHKRVGNHVWVNKI